MEVNTRAIRELDFIIMYEILHPRVKKRLQRLRQLLIYEKIDAEDALAEARMYQVRNPEFDGDWVGRPDDDYEDDEPDEDLK